MAIKTIPSILSPAGKASDSGRSLQREKGDIFVKPLPISNAQILSSLESSMRGSTGANIGTLREAVSIPSFDASSAYSTALNSVPLQSLGYFSALGVPAAGLRMKSALKKTGEARKLDDRTGVLLGVNEGILAASQATSTVSGTMTLSFSVKKFLNSQGGPSTNLSNHTHLTSSIMGLISSSFSLIGEWVSRGVFGLWGTSAFENEYRQKMSEGGSLDYLKNRFGLVGLDDSLQGKDLEKAGFSHLRSFGRRNIELLRKQDLLGNIGKLDDQVVDKFVKRYLGIKLVQTMGAEEIMAKARLKKQTEMRRSLGDKGFEILLAALSKPDVKSEEIDKIVLENINITQSARNKNILFYTAGTIITALMFVYTGGIGAAVLGLTMLGLYLIDAYRSHQKLEELKKTDNSLPGTLDKVSPLVGVGIALASIAFITTSIVLSIGSMGILPITVGLIGAFLLLLQSTHHLDVIEEKRTNYCNNLMKKKEITLDEAAYLCQHMPKTGDMEKVILKRIDEKEQARLQKFLPKEKQDGLLNAIKLRKEEIEAELAKALYSNLRLA